jgi:hypothetical protein
MALFERSVGDREIGWPRIGRAKRSLRRGDEEDRKHGRKRWILVSVRAAEQVFCEFDAINNLQD